MAQDSYPMIGQRLGSYVVQRQLGSGSMGTVFEAAHDQIGRRVAIKVLHPRFSQDLEVAARFLNEARAANLIRHPGVVGVFDFGQTATQTYLVMEYLDGESLRQRLDREGRLGISEALRLSRQIAAALTAAHRSGIIHRDLKPENVMLVPEPDFDDGTRVKILDFGVAKVAAAADSVRTQAGAILGTPAYMSPEHCHGADLVGEGSDVYALGIMLYELLGGRVPFVADSAVAVLVAHLQQAPRPVRELRPDLPEPLAALVMRMLSKAPEQRPAMAMVASELARLLREPLAEAPRARAFVVRASAPLIAHNYVLFDHPACTGMAGAVLLVTPRVTVNEAQRAHHCGVWYASDGRWSIYHQDLAPMPVGAAFHVLVVPAGLIHLAQRNNIIRNWTLLDGPDTSGKPAAVLLATANWSPPGQANVYNDHATGVWYTEGRWAIYNQDLAPMPESAAFNVALPDGAFVHRVTAASVRGRSATVIDHPAANDRPEAIVLVTANWNPGGLGGQYNDHPIGVCYSEGRWAVVNLDQAAMNVGLAFNVWVGSA